MGCSRMQLPRQITNYIADELYKEDTVGMSDSSVLVFQDKILKVQKEGKEAENEYRMMTWLNGKLQVPKVIAYEKQDGNAYLLMSKCEGEMACSKKYMTNPALQVKLLAQGLKQLWSVDITDCPADVSLKNKLEEARYNVEHGLVDTDNVEPDIFGEKGFKDPESLLKWLYENQPKEELTLSHGDFCLPNIFFKENAVSGYIDLGKTGIADKWCDIALCYRSLSHNHSGRYHGTAYSGLDDGVLFQELGIEPDWEKIRYYILLDELF